MCSVHLGIFSTSGVLSILGGISRVYQGDILSTPEDVHYIGEYHDSCGGYQEYIDDAQDIGVFNINQRYLSNQVCFIPGVPGGCPKHGTFLGLMLQQ